jgi:tripartite motif-containing protein 45
VLSLHVARQRGITRVRRQAMCPAHPELELQLFCAPCGQVACRECCLLVHRGHVCDTAARAAQVYTRSLRDALERARPVAEEAVVSLDRLQHLAQRIQV